MAANLKILVTVFQCNPVSGFWNRNVPADCAVSDYAFFIGNAVPNIITDVAILSLPLPCKTQCDLCSLLRTKQELLIETNLSVIFRLHRTMSQKIGLAGVFLLGGL